MIFKVISISAITHLIPPLTTRGGTLKPPPFVVREGVGDELLRKFYQYAILAFIKKCYPYIQIILAIVLGALILVRGFRRLFGSRFWRGEMGGASQGTRRGPELWILGITSLLPCLFLLHLPF